MILTIAAVLTAQTFLVRISDYQGGVAGEVEKRIEVKEDGSWARSYVYPGERGNGEVGSGKFTESALVKVKTAVRTLALTGDESHGDPDVINEHRVIIASGEGRIFIRGLPFANGVTLEECLKGEARLLGPRVKVAAELVGVVESRTR
jgi:hypothetical protein